MKAHKSLAILAILSLWTVSFHAEEITLEKIFLKGTFSQNRVGGLRSMKDGLHYSVMEKDKDMQVINKYDYAKGKKVSTLFKNSYKDADGNPILLESYNFSEDEK